VGFGFYRKNMIMKLSDTGLFSGGVRLAVAAVCAGTVVTLSGCAQVPRGNDGGRMGTTTMSPAEQRSAAIPITSLSESADQVVQDLAKDIQRVVDEEFKGFRTTIVLGALENRTNGRVSTQDMELIRDKVRTGLVRSKLFRDNVAVRERRAVASAVNQEELGVQGSPGTDPNLPAPTGAIASANQAYTMQLNGRMFGTERGPTNLYRVAFDLVRADNAEIVFSSEYEIKRD